MYERGTSHVLKNSIPPSDDCRNQGVVTLRRASSARLNENLFRRKLQQRSSDSVLLSLQALALLMSEMKTNAPPQILIYRTMGKQSKHCYIPYFHRQVSESTWIGLVSYQYCYTFIALNCLWMLVFFILGKIGAVPFLTSNMILYSHFSFLYWSIVR